MSYKIGFCAIGLSFLVSCGNNHTSDKKTVEEIKKDTVVATDQCTTLLNEAKRLDNILTKANVLNNDIADQAITAFYKFTYACKDDSLAPVFLLKSGQVSQAVKKYTQAQGFFKKCIDDFPEFKNRPAAMFLLAQLYDDATILNNESEARTLYQQIIKEYPKTSFATDAKASIKNLGKTDEQLIQEFLKKNK